MAKKSAVKTSTPAPSSDAALSPPPPAPAHDAQDVPVTEEKRTPVAKVNTANLSELKNAVDDVVKDFFSSPSHRFTRSYMHDDVRLALGWTAVGVAAATGWYGYKTEFHESKTYVGAGVVVYLLLNTALALYVAFVEKNTIFVGKRRTFASRISTERLTLSSLASSSAKHTTTSSWVPFPLSLLAPSSPPLLPASSTPSSSSPSSSPATSPYPLYALTLSYTHSSNANKSLLHANEIRRVEPLKQWFDAEGRIARGKVERWCEEALREVVGQGEGADKAL
ncbi:hypothetical protein JCM10207_002004 [Rhodosporidiobolus poonsookiae]